MAETAHDAAWQVLTEDRHDLYDASRESTIDQNETLGDEVCAAVADMLDGETPADAWVVTSLLEAVDGPWVTVYGDTVELRLTDDRLVLAGAGAWSHLEVVGDDGLEFWWTRLRIGCADALFVVDALNQIVRSGHPVAGQRTDTIEDVVPTCAACGQGVVPCVFGMPDGELFDAAELDYVRPGGGCVLPERRLAGPVGKCVGCGRQQTLVAGGEG